MRHYDDPIIPAWLTLAGAFIFFVLALATLGYWLPQYRCNEVGEVTGRSVQYRLMSGCYVKVDKRWVPRDSWRGEQELGTK